LLKAAVLVTTDWYAVPAPFKLLVLELILFVVLLPTVEPFWLSDNSISFFTSSAKV
jgi:hypothetical protein